MKENAETLIVADKEIGIEVNSDKSKYMIMFRDQNAGRSQNMKTDNRSFERVEDLKYLENILANQIFVQEEIKTRLKSGSACYHSV
jgi:hypothetical protein